MRANERTDERVAQYYSLYSWLLSTIVPPLFRFTFSFLLTFRLPFFSFFKVKTNGFSKIEVFEERKSSYDTVQESVEFATHANLKKNIRIIINIQNGVKFYILKTIRLIRNNEG